MYRDLDRPMSRPGLADNAEESVKCPVCGRFIEIGMANEYDYGDGRTVDCPVCHNQVNVDEAQHLGASNEGY
jgi:endogenous inhibitor of DNA gyrase (YacG/DUF329 family)